MTSCILVGDGWLAIDLLLLFIIIVMTVVDL